MARRVFFSFKYKPDVSRAMVVRHSRVTQGKTAAGFVDKTDFEKIKRRGDGAIQRWIDNQLHGTSVAVVLVGARTCASRWVEYEIEKSRAINNGLPGIDIGQINDLDGNLTTCCRRIPAGYPFYRWKNDVGYDNLGEWIEQAAKAAGR